MSDNTKRPAAEGKCPAPPPLTPVPSGARDASGPEAKREPPPNSHAAGAVPERDLTEALKQRLEETCLPADVKERLLAELPPPEECERMYRELQAKGGLSFEQLCDTLGIEVKPKP